jgi:hypothetical protein
MNPYPQNGAYTADPVVYEGCGGHIIKNDGRYIIYLAGIEIDSTDDFEESVALLRSYGNCDQHINTNTKETL